MLLFSYLEKCRILTLSFIVSAAEIRKSYKKNFKKSTFDNKKLEKFHYIKIKRTTDKIPAVVVVVVVIHFS